MHTLIVVGGGSALLIASLLLGHAWGNGLPGLLTGAKLFIPIWLICSALNMWIGVQHGYSGAEEFPIFLVIFAIPILGPSPVRSAPSNNATPFAHHIGKPVAE